MLSGAVAARSAVLRAEGAGWAPAAAGGRQIAIDLAIAVTSGAVTYGMVLAASWLHSGLLADAETMLLSILGDAWHHTANSLFSSRQ